MPGAHCSIFCSLTADSHGCRHVLRLCSAHSALQRAKNSSAGAPGSSAVEAARGGRDAAGGAGSSAVCERCMLVLEVRLAAELAKGKAGTEHWLSQRQPAAEGGGRAGGMANWGGGPAGALAEAPDRTPMPQPATGRPDRPYQQRKRGFEVHPGRLRPC